MSYNRQQLVIENFGGVDLSSSPLLVNSARASYMRNLINDNGVNHKRPGWRQELKINNTCTCSEKPCICNQINGIYEYKNGTYEVLIVYAGKTFYEVNGDDKKNLCVDKNEEKFDRSSWINGRVQFFRQRERLYIIGCGDYLVYGTWDEGESYELRRVCGDVDTYVPTTIIDKGPGLNGGGEIYDKLNILTRKRKNQFVQKLSGDYKYSFYTDASFSKLTKIIVNDVELGIYDSKIKGYRRVKGESTTEYYRTSCYCDYCWEAGIGSTSYTLPDDLNNGRLYYETEWYGYETENKRIEQEFCNNIVCSICGTQVLDRFLAETTTTPISKEECELGEYISSDNSDETGTYIGFTLCGDVSEYKTDKITVEFQATSNDEDHSQWISLCTFGTTFGAYGRADRLFLSGNSDMKNVDFYSGFEDFTYFPTNSRTEMGSDDAAITGYLRLSDSTLATFKEGFGNEPTVYYRKATEVDDNGATAVAFTRVDGSVGESCTSPYCTANLAGDDIMLSENGLFGIVIPENLNNNDRYFRERDRFINTALCNGKLSDSVGIVYKNRYYLSTGDGICYVADPRFKSYLSNDIDNSFNYEWWVWDNIPARVFAIIGGELYFGTADGKICVFDGAFTDRTYDETAEGEITIAGDTITYYDGFVGHIQDGKEIDLDDYDKRLYITNHDSENSTFKVSLTEGGEPIENIVDELYKGEAPEPLTMKVYCYKNVVSSWYTPVFSLGATDISKTLLSMSVTLDPRIRGRISFGYETKNVQRLLGARSGAFSFENFSFDDFSFDSGFTSSYTVKVKERHFNYVMFKFISDTNTDCAVCNFKATYIYNGRHRGTH